MTLWQIGVQGVGTSHVNGTAEGGPVSGGEWRKRKIDRGCSKRGMGRSQRAWQEDHILTFTVKG